MTFLDKASIPEIYKIFANPLPDYEIVVMLANGKLKTEHFEHGTLRKNLGNCTYKKPKKNEQCNEQIPNEAKIEILNGSGSLERRMHYDQIICAMLQISLKDIENRVFDLVQQMQSKIKMNQGISFSDQAERIIKLGYPPHQTKQFKGSPFWKYMPELCKEWVVAHREQAILDDNYEISRIIFSGSRECPFQNPNDLTYWGYDYGNLDYVIVDLTTQEGIAISSLTLHMIANHGCFQHSQHKYRLHPRKLIRILFRK
jgi:hypothetical protein